MERDNQAMEVESGPLAVKPSKTVLNRRFVKLTQLRKTDFFTLEAIKFRHPQLYSVYIGDRDTSGEEGITLTNIFQKALINCQYRHILENKLQTQTLESQNCEEESLTAEQLLFNDTMLISLLQRVFMSGADPEIDYTQVDNDETLDFHEIQNQDNQQSYFNTPTDTEPQPSTDTGIQDF